MGFGERCLSFGHHPLKCATWLPPPPPHPPLDLDLLYVSLWTVCCLVVVSWMAFYPRPMIPGISSHWMEDARTKSVCVCCNCNIAVCVIHSSLNLLLNCILLLFATYVCVGDRLHFLLLPPPLWPLYLSLALYCLSSFRSLSIRFV